MLRAGLTEQAPRRRNVGIRPKAEDGTWLVDMSKVGRGAERDPRYYIDNTMNPLDEVVVTAPKLRDNTIDNKIIREYYYNYVNNGYDSQTATLRAKEDFDNIWLPKHESRLEKSAKTMELLREFGNNANDAIYSYKNGFKDLVEDKVKSALYSLFSIPFVRAGWMSMPKYYDIDFNNELAHLFNKSSYDDTAASMPQHAFLLEPDDQRRAMENKGYVYKGNTNNVRNKTYVAKAANNLAKKLQYNIPVYQTQPDEKGIGDTWAIIPKNYKGESYEMMSGYTDEIKNNKANIVHGGSYPAHYRTDKSGKIYRQADDLNDYNAFGTDVLNWLGYPTVITTGPRYLNESGINGALFDNYPLSIYLNDKNNNVVLTSKNGKYPTIKYKNKKSK